MKRLVGNWKMHKTALETKRFLEEALKSLSPEEVYLAVPFTAISMAASFGIHVGSQNVSHEPEGPFTGETSARMVKEAGAAFTLIGHSERRQHYGETDEMIHRKIIRADAAGLVPLLCVGEREGEDLESVLERQIKSALSGLESTVIAKMMIAYEPVWAIGTGKSATPDDAESAHSYCRERIAALFGKDIASMVPILYGGSVKIDNLKALLSRDEIGGALVGGASLEPASFVGLAQISKSVVS